MSPFSLEAALTTPRRWLVTGVAGFIGSHLAEHLLRLGHVVVGLDNLATGHRRNVEAACAAGKERFSFLEGDVAAFETCQKAVQGVDFVLHQAALGSVPRSIRDPMATHRANVDGFLNMLVAARDAKVERFVYASSSSVYGDDARLPKVESQTGNVLSPYAATKQMNEVYAQVFARTYPIQTVGLRYFNVFGPRQDPDGPYAAVIPRWVKALMHGQVCDINGDGSTSRDFCFVANVVQANVRAALAPMEASGRVYNVAVGGKTSLLSLYGLIRERVAVVKPDVADLAPQFRPFRAGDIKDSRADISLAINDLGYVPTHTVEQGLDETLHPLRLRAWE